MNSTSKHVIFSPKWSGLERVLIVSFFFMFRILINLLVVVGCFTDV